MSDASDASERTSESGPVLTSGFLFVPDHSALTHKKNVVMSENRVK